MTDTDHVMVLCASQDKIEITFDADGDAIITQTRWPDEDAVIVVSRDNIEVFIDKLSDALGVPTFGRPMNTFRSQSVTDRNAGSTADLEDDQDDEDPAERKRKAAAERQRRRREKRRDRDGVTEAVTERDAERDSVTTAPALPEFDLNGGQSKALAH